MDAPAMMRAFLTDTRGATAAEFALVLPLFLITVFTTINMGLAMSAIVRLHFVTEKAARCLSVDMTGTCTPANLNTYARGLYQIGSVSNLTFTPAVLACGNQVTATGKYNVMFGAGTIPIKISASACYPII
ncbi:MAG: pilus assembly protein [Novosphingobium sp.]|jgi:Flp pilus assembly protein TadG|nr:pilus assembly protein [Novosphingobium sp.]